MKPGTVTAVVVSVALGGCFSSPDSDGPDVNKLLGQGGAPSALPTENPPGTAAESASPTSPGTGGVDSPPASAPSAGDSGATDTKPSAPAQKPPASASGTGSASETGGSAAAGSTACVPSCDGRVCGWDGCGGSCGTCNVGDHCDASGHCVPEGGCGLCADGAECDATAPGGASNWCFAGDCGDVGFNGRCTPEGLVIWCDDSILFSIDCSYATDGAGHCGVHPQGGYFDCIVPKAQDGCGDRECGPDGAGGVCGTCGAGTACTPEGSCAACTPTCSGKTCGDDGCGGSCGTCGTGTFCSAGVCTQAPQATCQGRCQQPYDAQYICHCDADCFAYDDCCADACAVCGAALGDLCP